jgi:hypothetical protein
MRGRLGAGKGAVEVVGHLEDTDIPRAGRQPLRTGVVADYEIRAS